MWSHSHKNRLQPPGYACLCRRCVICHNVCVTRVSVSLYVCCISSSSSSSTLRRCPLGGTQQEHAGCHPAGEMHGVWEDRLRHGETGDQRDDLSQGLLQVLCLQLSAHVRKQNQHLTTYNSLTKTLSLSLYYMSSHCLIVSVPSVLMFLMEIMEWRRGDKS